MTDFDAVQSRARALLTLPVDRAAPDIVLVDHAQRVLSHARALCDVPGILAEAPDPTATSVAALFHDAGWAIRVRDGSASAAQVLGRPTSDALRDLACEWISANLADVLASETLTLAVETLRQCGTRSTKMPEAQVVMEAVNLSEIGLVYLLRQQRLHHADGRSLDQLLAAWTRQREYKFWEARINDTLRFEASRVVARARLAAVEAAMSSLAQELRGDDLVRSLRVNTPPE